MTETVEYYREVIRGSGVDSRKIVIRTLIQGRRAARSVVEQKGPVGDGYSENAVAWYRYCEAARLEFGDAWCPGMRRACIVEWTLVEIRIGTERARR